MNLGLELNLNIKIQIQSQTQLFVPTTSIILLLLFTSAQNAADGFPGGSSDSVQSVAGCVLD
jgi:hypothetical protein